MAFISDLITAQNVADYSSNVERQPYLGAQLFPARKQLGLKLNFIKGAQGKPVVLKASAFDTKVTFRDRMEVELMDEQMPFFKEAMLVKETDRQELNKLAGSNSALVEMVVGTIFNDTDQLVAGALAQLEAMRMSVLATGMIHVKSNGVARDFDYGLDENQRSGVPVVWGEENAKPLEDIEKAKEQLEEQGGYAEILFMNSKTYGQIREAQDTKDQLGINGTVRRSDVEDYLMNELGLRIQLVNESFIDSDGVKKKYFPDGRVTLAPNSTLGATVFGTTPEESDLVSGNNLDVQIVNTGIAITTETLTDPVNVSTKVSMIALPSFEELGNVYLLDTTTQEV